MPLSTAPSSYISISPPFSQISLSHNPSTSATVTPIIIISINRPQKNNAFTTIMENELVRAFDLLDQDDRVKVIVVTGKGKMFCAGADLPSALERIEGEGAKSHRDG
jgi:enoyl-CoA hydratase/carnithine racemase